MWLSKTRIFDYEFCPKRFEYKYIEKVPSRGDVAREVMGRNFHLFFEAFFSEVDIHNGMNALECMEEIRRAALYVASPMSGDLESYIDFQWTTAKDYYHIIQTFIDAESARAAILQPDMLNEFYYPVALEARFKIPELKFEGIIDRIDLDPTMNYTVIDYKTGAVKKNVSKIRKELCWYKLGAEALGYKPVTYGSMFFPRHNYVFLERIKPISVTYAIRTIKSVADKIEEGKFPPRIGRWCEDCPYFDICEVSVDDEQVGVLPEKG